MKMKPIKFDCNGRSAPAYGCSEPGDNSGEYVRADVAQQMYDALKKIDADLENRNFLESSSLRDTSRAALAAADGDHA